MAFRASNLIPDTQYVRAKQIALQMKRFAADRSLRFSSGANTDQIFAVVRKFRQNLQDFQAIASIPGISAFAQSQEDDDTYDVVAEFNAMIASVEAVIDEIVTTFPTDADGKPLYYDSLNADGTLVPETFTAAQLSNLRTKLDTVANSVI